MTIAKILGLGSVLALSAAWGCSDPKPQATPTDTPRPPSAQLSAPALVEKTKPAISEDDVRAFLSDWTEAQNTGDFAGYSAMYDQRFYGIRRSGPRTRAFHREGWLKDRERMFKEPMHVRVDRVQVLASADVAVVTFEQEWSSASYHDEGPKRMVLVRHEGKIAISNEELLTSSELPSSPSSQARLVLAVQNGPAYVLLAPTEVAPGSEPTFAEAASPSVASFAYPDDAPKDAAQAWLQSPVRLIGSAGSCETRVRALRIVHSAYVHFGTLQSWSGQGPEPKASAKRVAADLKELAPSGYLALELERACVSSPLIALPGAAETAAPVPLLNADDALVARAKDAFLRLRFVRKMSSNERAELLSEAQLSVFGNASAQWVAVGSITSCAVGVQAFALFRVKGESLEPVLTSEQTELLSVAALIDLDRDGVPEVIGSGAYGTPLFALTIAHPDKPLLVAPLPYFDCPC